MLRMLRSQTLSSRCGLVSLFRRMRTRAALSDLKTAVLLRAFTQRNVGLQSKWNTATDLDKDYRCYSGFTAMQNKKMRED